MPINPRISKLLCHFIAYIKDKVVGLDKKFVVKKSIIFLNQERFGHPEIFIKSAENDWSASFS